MATRWRNGVACASTEPGVDRQEQVDEVEPSQRGHGRASTEPGVDRQEQAGAS